jgi:hypothetical protein
VTTELFSKEFQKKKFLTRVAMRLLPDSLATEEVVGRTVARAGLSRLWRYKDRPSPTVPARRGPNYLPERGTSKPIH